MIVSPVLFPVTIIIITPITRPLLLYGTSHLFPPLLGLGKLPRHIPRLHVLVLAAILQVGYTLITLHA